MDEWSNGTEIVAAYTWNAHKISADAVVLMLSHPRFGKLAYFLGAVDVARLVTQLQATLSKTESAAPTLEPQQKPH